MKRLVLLLPLVACGPKNVPIADQETPAGVVKGDDTSSTAPAAKSWSDWTSYTNVSPGPWMSPTHGKRFVEIYVNDIGLEAYKARDAEMPVGSIVVKPSWENEDGVPGADGPLFVMEKMPAGYAPDAEDWFYAFLWADPPEKWKKRLGSNVDDRSPSEKVQRCIDCHENYDRSLGMLPQERMADW